MYPIRGRQAKYAFFASPCIFLYLMAMNRFTAPAETWKRNLYVLWGTQFLAMIGMNLVIPFLPFFIRSLGVTNETELSHWSGLVFAGPFFLSFFTTPLWGALGDRYGRKMMVVRAIFGLALAQVLIGFSQNVYQLFAFRIVQGAVSGFIASALALVSTSTPKARIGYALGFMQSATAGGTVLGPFVGGLLADFIGYRSVFFLTAALCVAGGIVVALFVREERNPSHTPKRYTVMQNYRYMLSDRRLRAVGVAMVVAQASVLMIEPIFALYIEKFAHPAATRFMATLAGGIFSLTGVFMVFSAPWWGKRNDRNGHRKDLSTALILGGLFYAGHIVVTDLLQLSVLRSFLGFARGGILPSLYALCSVYSPQERRGGIVAIAASFNILGNMVGPVLGGYVAGRLGMTASFLATTVLMTATGLYIRNALDDAGRSAEPSPDADPGDL
jgi:MFS transporter, DHA1 family, multidrug resistance protein